MRLIDADTFTTKYDEQMVDEDKDRYGLILLSYAPTIDAVPIDELLKLRDWLYESDGITMGGLRSLNELIAKYSSRPLPRIESGYERR